MQKGRFAQILYVFQTYMSSFKDSWHPVIKTKIQVSKIKEITFVPVTNQRLTTPILRPSIDCCHCHGSDVLDV